MAFAWKFFGFDPIIMERTSKTTRLVHSIIGSMLIIVCLLLFFGSFQFFKHTAESAVAPCLIAIFVSLIFWILYRLCFATCDFDLPHFNQTKELEDNRFTNTDVVRFLFISIFAIHAGQGIVLWLFESYIDPFFVNCVNGKYNNASLLRYLVINESATVEDVNTLTNRIKVVPVMLGGWKWLLIFPYTIVVVLFLIPLATKMYIPGVYNSEYDYWETEIENRIIISEYLESKDQINLIRHVDYGLKAYNYQTHKDPPYNTIPLKAPTYEEFDLKDFFDEDELVID